MLEALVDWLLNASLTLLNIPFMFGPAEYVALIVLLLMLPVVLAPSSLCKALAMLTLGLLLGGIVSQMGDIPGLMHELWEWNLYEVLGLVVFGFLLPCIVAYARQPSAMQGQSGWRIAYNGLFMPHTLPALLLMRQSWWPARWVLPALVTFAAYLGVYWDLLPNQHPQLFGTALVIGLCALRLDLPLPPLLAGLATQPVLEENLHRALLLSRGDWTTFATRPISAGLLLLAVLLAICCWWLRARLLRPANHPSQINA